METSQSSNQFFLSVLESMTDAFCVVDMSWRLVYANGRAEQIMHLKKEDLLGSLVWDAFRGSVGAALYNYYQVNTGEAPKRETGLFCSRLGAWIEIYTIPSPLGLAFYFRDVTAQRRSAEDLEQLSEQIFSQHAYLETLLRHIPVGVMICQAPGGRVLYGNERMEQLLGHPIVAPKNIAEYAVWRGFHPDGRPYEAQEWPLARAIATGEVVSGEEIHIERIDGRRLALLVSASPIRDRMGRILAGIVVDQDITEQKQTLDAMKASVHLEQQARHDAEVANSFKDQFIAMVSHELRTPLTPVVMSLAAMESDPHLPETLFEEVAMLRRNVGLETKLIDDLLDVTSIANGKISLSVKPMRIHPLLRHVLEIVGGEAQAKGQKLTLDLAAPQDLVSGDPVRLHQVFWNLLKNAIKFAPPDGEIWIRTLNPTPTTVAIEVKDGGIGITVQAMPRIFGAFEQADQSISRQFGGLGLGLTICKAIVDLHGGTIHAESAGPGKGARFRADLPLAIGVEQPVAEALGKATTNGNSLRILAVDDHADTLNILRRLLEANGYRVATAGTVAGALDYLAANEVDVLVSDIGLPDASGLDLIRQVMGVRQIPAVAISGFGSAVDIQNSLDAGFGAHLTKPLDLNLLHATIQQLTHDRAPRSEITTITVK
jgi:PAS domain S-box-containing protein